MRVVLCSLEVILFTKHAKLGLISQILIAYYPAKFI